MEDRTYYSYDGSFAGLLTCVEESFRRGETPMGICPAGEGVPAPCRRVVTDPNRARAFYRRIGETATKDAQRLVAHAYLTCLEDREMAIWRFLDLARQRGSGVMYTLNDPRVSTLNRAVRAMAAEARQYRTSARFSDSGGLLWSGIAPENRVLYLLRSHFCQRFAGESLLIYDSRHREALLYRKGKWHIRPAPALELPPEQPAEEDCNALWRRFEGLWTQRKGVPR